MVAAAVPAAVSVVVMSATPAVAVRAAAGGRERLQDGPAVPGVDRRVGAAIGHGR